MSETKKDKNNYFLSESPIEQSEDDILNYRHYAEKIRKIIQKNVNNPSPLTLGIYGKWGEGKTSFLNLVRNQIDIFRKENGDKGIMRYHFNPWRYKTEDEMIFSFFEGLAQSLFLEKESNLHKAGKYIKGFGKYLKAIKLSASVGLPVSSIGSKVTFDPSVIFETLGNDLKGEELSLELFKDKIDESLNVANWKIVIFIDDVDRLDKNEIYTLLKIIKLNGSFKNLVYLIPMDQEQVAKAIKNRFGDDIKDGYMFLEKIINIPINLPKIEYSDLRIFFSKKLEEVYRINDFDSNLLEKKRNELEEITDNYFTDLFTTPREIIRVLNSFYIGLFSIGKEVHLADLFWIEYLKVIMPDIYSKIKKYNIKSFLGFKLISYDNIFDDLEINSFNSIQLKIVSFILPKEARTVFDDFTNSFGNRIDSKYRINQPDHFDKYFSYHLMNKLVLGDFNEFVNKVLQDLEDESGIIIKDLIQKYGDRKTLYELESIINLETDSLKTQKMLKSIIQFRNLFSSNDPNIFGKTTKTELIERVAIIMNSELDNEISYKELIIELAEKLNYQELSHFTRKFKDKPIREDLNQKILKKVKNLDSSYQPFFKYPENIMNKMVMQIWKNSDEDNFKDFIRSNLDSKELVGLFVRNFPGYWNGSYFGPLTKENYEFMKSLIDVHFVKSKVDQYYNINTEKLDINEWNNKEDRTIDENVQEFVFHYNEDKKFPNFA